MPPVVKLVGLDFGTTTSSAVIASALLTRNAVTGRSELTGIRELYRSELVFTPLNGDLLDEQALAKFVDGWLAKADVKPNEVFGGGALLTGLAAQRANAPAVVRTIRCRLRDALIATADDPSLESWLAFMGSCAELSRTHLKVPFINLDIGGGTTNLALGLAGNVLRTGCLRVGARHIQVVPGSYQIRWLSPYASELLADLRIAKGIGDCLTEIEVNAVLSFYMSMLTSAIDGNLSQTENAMARLHEVSPFQIPSCYQNAVVTVSGGVGALIYQHLNGEPWPSTTSYGDLGIDLARRLIESPWVSNFRTFVPQSAGRATVYGLLRHSTEVSGNTLFLPNPDCLPLTDVPILGVIAPDSTESDIENLIVLARKSTHGACLRIDQLDPEATAVRLFAGRLSRILRAQNFPAEQPLVLLTEENIGKVMGHYVTEWGELPLNLLVIDEIVERHSQYVRIGRVHEQVVPVSFHGEPLRTGQAPIEGL